ncbi:Diacylglycerol acyltransferase/mycolyltransferase Ag85B precursor [Actinomadura rubteroloni]|uniref:Diacylglycerol acyltransferase/mycolyltransferase Ag85B n=1 Tax=Actinomadura rubteroloni TaxID=1926885 RepID=A0A2P4UNT0_9ACTN|nr:alpha/beta hydrolase family protein [Actinomadura rubteroloni]POM26704.1 Diacylglycerol acyltransferase/mycolyltransferase Ag85B precursor [Actinomadura rubteroloni]
MRRALVSLTLTVLLVPAAPALADPSPDPSPTEPAPTEPAYVPADDGGSIAESKQVDAQTIDLTIDTPLVDTSKPRIRLYTPAGWSRTSTATWPIVYVYGGGPGSYTEWAGHSDLPATAKRSRALVALVDGGKAQGFTDWYNGGRGGNPRWETFHTQEVLQLLERNFRASTNRAVMGISSGGQGALTYASRHPGLFKFAACFSSLLHITAPGLPEAMMFTDYARPEPTVPDPLAKWGDPAADRRNWLDHDPYEQAEGLRGTRLFVSAGDGTQGPLDEDLATLIAKNGLNGLQIYTEGAVSETLVASTTADFLDRLGQLGIPVTTDLYGPGFHQWKYWDREYKKAWPLIMDAIGG